jgi:Transposase
MRRLPTLSHGGRHGWRDWFTISASRWVAGQDRASRRLLLPVSKDTLLRVVRRHAAQPATEPRVVGIDDWAWKRGHRYGTIICDLERRRIIDILPDREAATVASWLTEHPSITVIARDRGVGYSSAKAMIPKRIGRGTHLRRQPARRGRHV